MQNRIRAFIAAMAIAALVAAAPVQAFAKGKRQQQEATKAEDLTKKKAEEEAYKNALKSIPVSNEKRDPWKALR
jgi:ribosomal protein L12E/L44/L45/RPP1/RPP2